MIWKHLVQEFNTLYQDTTWYDFCQHMVNVWPMTPDSSRLLAGGSDTLCNSISRFQGPIIFPRSVKCYITRFSETWELISKSLTSGRGLMGLDHDQNSWKGDLIGLWSEQNRFLKLVNVVELNANVTDQGNRNEGMRNRKWKWKSVVIATTITGARALWGTWLRRPSVSWYKGILWTCLKGLSALLLGLYQWWLWHSRMQSHKRESVLTLPDPLFVPMMDIVCGCSGLQGNNTLSTIVRTCIDKYCCHSLSALLCPSQRKYMHTNTNFYSQSRLMVLLILSTGIHKAY